MSLKEFKFKVLWVFIHLFPYLFARYFNEREREVGNEASMAGGVGLIMLFISVFISCIFGLSLVPSFYTFAVTASNAFNNTTYEVIMDIIYLMVIPVGWAMLCMCGIFGAVYGVFRLAKRL